MTSVEGLLFENISLNMQIVEEKINEEDNILLKNSVEEIEKIDALIKLKENEEKKMKLSRIQAEEESRNILMQLHDPEAPDVITNNCIKFINIINQQKKSKFDISKEENNVSDIVEKEKEKRKSMKTRHAFIERNIQLAKCGKGTLSMTEEESLRIKNLVDSEESETEKKSENGSENTYGFESEFQSKLAQIDEQLGQLAKFRVLEEDPEFIDVKSPNTAVENNEEKCKNQLNKKNRLKEIDLLLDSMNSVSLEEIKPLPQLDVEALIRRGQRSEMRIQNLLKSEGKFRGDFQNLIQFPTLYKPFQEILSELVKNAKSLMPKFKYRYGEY